MTTSTEHDFITDLSVAIYTAPGALDYDERPDEADAFAEEAANILSGAVAAALQAISERYPSLGVSLRIDGTVVR